MTRVSERELLKSRKTKKEIEPTFEPPPNLYAKVFQFGKI